MTTTQQMANMRRQGHTFQQIGDEVGITREGARLRLEKYFPGLKPASVSEKETAKIVGCSASQLRTLRGGGVLKPKRIGYMWLYDREEIEKAVLAVQRVCAHCGKGFLMFGSASCCPECRVERIRYNYPFLSGEGKKKHCEAIKRWQQKNPERAKAIQQRAMRRYAEKQRVEALRLR